VLTDRVSTRLSQSAARPFVSPTAVDEPIADTGGHLVSGEAVELEIRVARVGSRALALLLDIAVEVVAMIGFLTVVPMLLGVLVPMDMQDEALVQALVIMIVVAVVVGYPVLMETFVGGRTLGKLALGLRVVRDDGGPIRFRHALTRCLVSVAIEWPGLILPMATWIAGLTTMLVNPRGKRLGDLAAGTLVIHDRTPATWGWVPIMPPPLAGWARTLDLTGLPDDLALAVRHFLARNRNISVAFRARIGYDLAREVAALTTPPPPPGTPGWMYLAAVISERHRRAAHRLARARRATAQVYPGLGQPPQWQQQSQGGPSGQPPGYPPQSRPEAFIAR
jgi:uncharacterized RDD family membrane protein YckC